MVKLNKSGNRRGRCLGETGLLAAELIHAAGAEGLSTMQMREMLADRTPAARRTVMIAAQRGKFIKRSYKQLCVYYAPTVPLDVIPPACACSTGSAAAAPPSPSNEALTLEWPKAST